MALQQRTAHIVTEALGIWAGWKLFQLADNMQPKEAATLRAIGVATLLIDAYFIGTWFYEGS